MVVNNLNVCWAGGPAPPLKTNSPLVIDANAVLTLSVALQSFESVARQRTEISEFDSCFQTIKLEPAARSIPENALIRLPEAKSLVRLSR